MKSKVIIIGIIASLASLGAQAQKIGFVSTDYVLAQMPEAKQIQSELQAYEKQLSNKIQATVQGYQQQLQAYQQGAATMTEEARKAKEEELTKLQQQIQQDQQEAQQNLQKKQGELVQPALAKIQEAINKVAKAEKYTHVLSPEVVLYVENEDEANLSDKVLNDMGITPTPGNAPTPGTGTDTPNE